MTAAAPSPLTDQQQPLSLNNLHIAENSRQELFSEQLRLREENKRRKNQDNTQQMRFAQYFQFKPTVPQERKTPSSSSSSSSSQTDKPIFSQVKLNKPRAVANINTNSNVCFNQPPQVNSTSSSTSNSSRSNEPLQQQTPPQSQKQQAPPQVQLQRPNPPVQQPPMNHISTHSMSPVPPVQYPNLSPINSQSQHAVYVQKTPQPPVMYAQHPPQTPHVAPPPPQPPQPPQAPQQQFQSTSQQETIVIDDDEVVIDEEKTNSNICIGMIITDIVVEKPPLVLPKDDQYEIISLESEGKLNTDNYCKIYYYEVNYFCY